jgi:hypothetical protein
MSMNETMTQPTSDARELDMADLEAVNGGVLPAVIQNIIARISCEAQGGDYYSNGTASTCAGPQG